MVVGSPHLPSPARLFITCVTFYRFGFDWTSHRRSNTGSTTYRDIAPENWVDLVATVMLFPRTRIRPDRTNA